MQQNHTHKQINTHKALHENTKCTIFFSQMLIMHEIINIYSLVAYVEN